MSLFIDAGESHFATPLIVSMIINQLLSSHQIFTQYYNLFLANIAKDVMFSFYETVFIRYFIKSRGGGAIPHFLPFFFSLINRTIFFCVTRWYIIELQEQAVP